MNRFKILSLIIAVVVLSPFAVSDKSFASFVVPVEFTNFADLPLSDALNCSSIPNGIRVQTLFPGDELAEGNIQGFTTRLFPGSPGINQVTIPIIVKMSTTTVTEGNLSNTFADNIGPDETTVFDGVALFNAPDCNTSFPVACPFPPIAELQTPFPYDPANGNLLLDITVPPCVGGIPSNVEQDATFNLSGVLSNDFQSPSGLPTGGFITEIKIEPNRPIPTLSEWGLIAMVGLLGLVGFIAIRKKYSPV